jgi:hypothetical protein
MIFGALELVGAVLLIWFVWTQLIVPTFYGRPKLPFFRKSTPDKLEKDMSSLREESAVLDKADEKTKLEERVKAKRNKSNPTSTS